MTIFLNLSQYYSESDRKFLEECAKLRDSNGNVVVSQGGKFDCDYDEQKEMFVEESTAPPYQILEPEKVEKRRAAKRYAKPKLESQSPSSIIGQVQKQLKRKRKVKKEEVVAV